MIETHLNLFDAAVIGILALSCLIAFFRGFVREILSLGAWVGAGIVTLYYFKPVAEQVKPYFKSDVVAAGVSTLGLYIAALIGFSLINWLLLKLFKSGSDVGMLDNMLGLAFGAFRGAFIVSLGFFLLTIVLPENDYPKWLKTSITRPYVEKGALMLASVSPDYLREISSLEKRAQDYATEKNKSPYWQEDSTGDEASYRESTRRQLDRLIDSNEPAR